MIRLLAAWTAAALAAAPAAGFELALPSGAGRISERSSPLDSYSLPSAPFDGSSLPAVRVEGRVERQTWRIEDPGLTTLQVLAPLRDQLEAAGYAIIFDCEDRECGGFDFRFATEVVPAPDMYVDIRNYRFVAATRARNEAVSLLVSESRSAAFVQIVYVNRALGAAPATAAAPDEAGPSGAPGLIEMLTRQGHAVLRDLLFDSGAEALDAGKYESLEQLAGYLNENPGIVIALVGHTDAVGPLEQNISLSKRRAQSVRSRLTGTYGIAPERVQAEGMGYLAPVASNLTAEGREANRRVEAVLLSDG